MINLSQLNKLIQFTTLILILSLNISYSDTTADIWKKKENDNTNQADNEEPVIDSPIITNEEISEEENINELTLESPEITFVGLFDPEENNLDLRMWLDSDGNDIKKIFRRINKLRLSKFSEDLLFQVLFTNAYPPNKNLTSSEFLKIKIDWLIKNQRIEDLEKLLLNNPEVGKESKAIKYLINERLSGADIKSACEKVNVIDKKLQNNYLDKFRIYCLINDDRKEEAQLVFELLKERGFKDSFFQDKIDILLGFKEKENSKILDDNLLNFYLSQITAKNFDYQPNEKTNKYIWRYLSSSNLIKINDFENEEEVILTYEKAAAEDSFKSEDIFNIYKQILFNVNQLMNATEIYKNLPNYKARALIYQSILLSDNVERKINLTFLLKDLFKKDKLNKIYSKEMANILRAIDPNKIPNDYKELVESNMKQNFEDKKIKFDNDILHRSKVIKHFLDNDQKINKTEKDFKSVYKKIKRNKKYFISIMDIIVLESLEIDGMKLPQELDFSELSSQLTVPANLQDLADKKQLGLLMLKIIELIGEDDVRDLDPETIYFLNKIMNELNLKKIRNNILSEKLPVRV